MRTFVILCTDRSEAEVQASNPTEAEYVARRAAGSTGKAVFSVRPLGCTGLSPTVHLGRLCPIHHGVHLKGPAS